MGEENGAERLICVSRAGEKGIRSKEKEAGIKKGLDEGEGG